MIILLIIVLILALVVDYYLTKELKEAEADFLEILRNLVKENREDIKRLKKDMKTILKELEK